MFDGVRQAVDAAIKQGSHDLDQQLEKSKKMSSQPEIAVDLSGVGPVDTSVTSDEKSTQEITPEKVKAADVVGIVGMEAVLEVAGERRG